MFTILRHFIKEDREKCIERIRRLNSDLDKLVNGAPPIAVIEPQKLDAAKHYQRVRKRAVTLYGALKERLQITSCLCKVCTTVRLLYLLGIWGYSKLFSSLTTSEQTPHSANLQLDVCILGTYNNIRNNHVPKIGHLSLLFPIPVEQVETGGFLMRRLEFENLEDPDPVENTLDEDIPQCLQVDTREEVFGRLLH